jgi:hypothetical protein
MGRCILRYEVAAAGNASLLVCLWLMVGGVVVVGSGWARGVVGRGEAKLLLGTRFTEIFFINTEA